MSTPLAGKRATPTADPTSADTMVGLRHALRSLERQVSDAMRINLDPAGLSVEDWAVISLLADGEGHTMAEVIDAASIPPASATRLVDRLVSSVLLHRTTDAHDRRRVLVALAPRGRQLYAKLAPAQAQIAGLLAARMGAGTMAELIQALGTADAALRGG